MRDEGAGTRELCSMGDRSYVNNYRARPNASGLFV